MAAPTLDLPNLLRSGTLSVLLSSNPNSEVWRYFGKLANFGEDILQKQSKVFCKLCLDSGNFKEYSCHVSTGNLHTHLQQNHQIDTKTKSHAKQMQKLTAYFEGTSRPTQASDEKWKLGREICLWFCRDLPPFHTVAKNGFQNFCCEYGITNSSRSLPDEQTIGSAALNDVYNLTLGKVKAALSSAGDSVSITLDCWTDNYRRISYITYTCHWLDDLWKLQNISLGTSPFPHPHTGEAIAADIQQTLKNFSLDGRIFRVTTDGGANIIKALKLCGLQRHPCLAHGMHNLIKKDFLDNGTEDLKTCSEILKKIRAVHRSLLYKYDELSSSATEIKAREETSETEEILALDDQYDTMLLDENCTGTFTTLKRDVPTRWNSIQTMLTSFLENRAIIKDVLERHQLYEKILLPNEIKAAIEIKKVLEFFEIATDVLQGSSYPSIHLSLLIRSEIVDRISMQDADSDLTKSIKKTLLSHLEHRFPVTEDIVCACLLDPGMKRLTIIETYLAEKNQSKLKFLMQMCKSYGTPVRGAIVHKEGAENDVKDEPKTKKKKNFVDIKNELLKKHSLVIPDESLDAEVKKYLLVAISSEDVLDWWRKNEYGFPNLANLAKRFLSIQVTSAPSERAFSTAGLVVTSRRSSLHPLKVKKILFVHDNYDAMLDI
ncbi:Zinc finger BED domain-containing protein 1 [Folsomia candida]|uniref:Zinc finger BED domain-containing protein 1 n=1 Tax=Folsomia candida TaxID=158441 RepID=A0A226DDY8_FOLCA|nr:Zinc finger BED domain-containing protein 1 [Folsomia candida]